MIKIIDGKRIYEPMKAGVRFGKLVTVAPTDRKDKNGSIIWE